MNTCRTCRYWVGDSPVRAEAPGTRPCTCEKLTALADWDRIHPDAAREQLLFVYDEGGGEIYTGPDFGCVHHTEAA